MSVAAKREASPLKDSSIEDDDNDKERRNAFELMMDAARRKKRIKPNPSPPEMQPAKTVGDEQTDNNNSQPQPANAFEKLMAAAQKPLAFCNNVCTDEDILGYLNRHPEWRLLMSELIHDEELIEDIDAEDLDDLDDEEDEILENLKYISSSIPPLPTLPNILDQQIWANTRHLEGYHYATRDDSVRFDRSDYVRLQKVLCGWTLIYDDSVEFSCGDTDTSPVCTATVKLKLEQNEHICAIGLHDNFTGGKEYSLMWGPHLSNGGVGFLTTRDRWLIAWNGKLELNKTWFRGSWEAPPGEAFRFLCFSERIFKEDGSELELSNHETASLDNLNGGSTVPSSSNIPSLSSLCERKLDEHLKETASDSSKTAHAKLQYFWFEEALRRFRIRGFQEDFYLSQESKTVRALKRLENVAIGKLQTKCNLLLNRATRKQQKSIEEHQSKREECKVPCQQEQTRIYEDHLTFLETRARLSAEEDTVNDIGCSKALCIFPQCRAIYQPKNLPMSKRCKADGCGTAFEMCGCMIKKCPKCLWGFCPWHIHDHEKVCRWSQGHQNTQRG